ncbi:MAG: hypothetical protein ACJAVI_001323 [Candidatus Azotimanducaceae bacterium]|jgi:hypothetical protein
MLIKKMVLWSMLLCFLQSCTSTTSNPATQLLGSWQVEMAGINLIVEYSEIMVQVGGNAPVQYKLEGDELTFVDGGSQKRMIRFPGKDQMVQSDPLTGTERVYTRLGSSI